MIVVEIHDPEDGRLSHEVGPFESAAGEVQARALACEWRDRFVLATGFDKDFVEVRDVDRGLVDPVAGWDEMLEFYGD